MSLILEFLTLYAFHFHSFTACPRADAIVTDYMYMSELFFHSALQPVLHAAAASGVTYILQDTQSSHGCPCQRERHNISSTYYNTYVSYSAVNISVIAKNAAGYSPPAIIQVPAEPATDLKSRSKCVLSVSHIMHIYS